MTAKHDFYLFFGLKSFLEFAVFSDLEIKQAFMLSRS